MILETVVYTLLKLKDFVIWMNALTNILNLCRLNLQNKILKSLQKKCEHKVNAYPDRFIRTHVDCDKKVDNDDGEHRHVGSDIESTEPPYPFTSCFICLQYG